MKWLFVPKNYKSNPAILNEVRAYLDGLMLGDGCIPHKITRSRTNRYEQGCKHKNWLDIIRDDLYEYNIKCNLDNGRVVINKFTDYKGLVYYYLQTYSYIEFKEMHDRWYKKWYDIDNCSERLWHIDEDGEYFIWKKIVPKDICLTPQCVSNWYLGDGYLQNQSVYGRITIATNGFLRDDIIFLLDLLSEVLDIKSSVNGDGVVGIYIQSDISLFFNYIKYCKIPVCYGYKFPKELIK